MSWELSLIKKKNQPVTKLWLKEQASQVIMQPRNAQKDAAALA